MATISNKSVKRAAAAKAKADTKNVKRAFKKMHDAKTNAELNAAAKEYNAATDAMLMPSRANNPPPDNLPKMTVKQWLGLENEENTKTVAAEIAKSHRIRGALLLAWNDPDHVARWSQYFAATTAANKDQKTKDAANAFFDRDLNIPARNTLTGDALKDRDNRRARLMRSVDFLMRLRTGALLPSFSFNENGVCFLDSKSTLGKHIWKAKKWIDDKDLTDVMNPIQIVDRPTTKNVAVSWIELERYVIPTKTATTTTATTTTVDTKTGETTTVTTEVGDGAATLKSMRLDRPLDMLTEANKAFASATEISLLDRQHAIEEMERTIAVMFKDSAYIDGRMLFASAFAKMRETLKMKPSGATGSGKPTSAPLNVSNVLPFSPTKGMAPAPGIDTLPLKSVKVSARKVTAAELKAHNKRNPPKKTANKRR